MSKISDGLHIGENASPPPFEVGKSAVSKFWDVIKGNGWPLVKINLLTLLFFLPLIVWQIIVTFTATADAVLLPYSGNIGIGLPVVTDAVAVGAARAFSVSVRRWLFTVPMIPVGAIGLSGAFYALKRLVLEGEKPTVKAFFKGIARSWLPFLLTSVFVALAIFALFYSIASYSVTTDLHIALKITEIISSALLLVITLLMALFVNTQSVSYKLKFGANFSNSVRFSVMLFPRSIVILALCALPIVVTCLVSGFIATILIAFFLLIGFSFIALIATVYTQWAFEKYLNGKIRGKNNAKPTESRKEKKRRMAAEAKSEE